MLSWATLDIVLGGMGSPLSEERDRSSRRPKREPSGVHQNAFKLPPIQELANPWGGTDSEGRYSFIFNQPVATTSTPRRSVSTHNTHTTLSYAANMSGHPPTPHSVGSSFRDDGEATGRHGRSASRQEQLREHSVAFGEGRPLTTSREGSPDALGLLEATDRPFRKACTLREVLADTTPAPSARLNEEERRGDVRWPGGYAPSVRGPRREHEDVGEGQRSERRGRTDAWQNADREESYFQAIPNTKAWDFASRRGERLGSEALRDEDERMMTEDGEAYSQHREDWEEGSRSNTHASMRGEALYDDMHEANEYEEGYSGRTSRGPPDWNAGPEYGAVPTAMAADDEAEDTPVLLDVPTDSKWATHFDDPETIVNGQSGEWTRVIWRDSKPIVLFTVFNYRYTKDGAINRHIESAVTSLTTFLTGETKIYVVPPEPETGYAIKPRDLPFVWVIRGLSERGARTMTRLRAISTKAVSIMTFPRVLGNPRWVCGLIGFMRRDVETIRAAVLHVLRSEHMMKRLEDLTSSSRQLDGMPQNRRVEYVIASLKITLATAEEDDFVANVYLFPPTDDMGRWREWAAEMRASRYNIFLNGSGIAKKVFWCAGCRGVDHENGECPFPAMKGWKGPMAGDRSHMRESFGKARRGGPGGGRGLHPSGGEPRPIGGGRGRAPTGYWEQDGYGRGRGGGNQRGQGSRGAWQSRIPSRGWTPRGFGRGAGGSGRWN